MKTKMNYSRLGWVILFFFMLSITPSGSTQVGTQATVNETIDAVSDTFAEVGETLLDTTLDWMKENPWGFVLALGLIIAFIML